MKRILWVTLMAVGVSQIGCGNKSDETASNGAAGAGSPTATQVAPSQLPSPSALPNASNMIAANSLAPAGTGAADAMVPLSSLNLANPTKPEEVVGAFLDGMRTGNARVIESLLSTRARKEITDKGLDIAPIGSPQARFEIGAAQVADPKDPNTMLVSSNWQEPGANGQPAGEYEVVWALVREATGWRICEMAVDTHQEGEEIQVVNFENLADVVPANAPQSPSALSPEIPRTASAPGGPGSVPAPGSVPSSLPSGSLPSGSLPTSLPTAPTSLPTGLPGSSPAPAQQPSFNPPTIRGGLPSSAPGPVGTLPPAPGGTSAGPGGLPPLPPAGFGNGSSG